MFTQDTAQFGQVPYRRFEINLSGVDRSDGQYFPEIEGKHWYIERADIMVVAQFVVQGQGDNREGLVLREGFSSRGNAFKGMTLYHSLNTVTNTTGAAMKLVIMTSDFPFTNNGYPVPSRYPTAVRSASATTGGNQISIPLPEGARLLDLNLVLDVTNATAPTGIYTVRARSYATATLAAINNTKTNPFTKVQTVSAVSGFCGVTGVLGNFVGYGGTGFRARISELNIPIPNDALDILVTVTYDAAVTTNNTDLTLCHAYFK